MGALGFRPWSFTPCGGKLPFGGSSITIAVNLPLVRPVLATVLGVSETLLNRLYVSIRSLLLVDFGVPCVWFALVFVLRLRRW